MLHAKIKAVEQHVESDDRRTGTDRVAVGRPSTIRAHDFAPRDVVVEDLSSTGFLFQSEDNLTLGTTFHVGLGGGGMSQARVVRLNDGRYGCEFIIPLTEQQLALAFTAGFVVPGAFPTHHTAPLMPYRDVKWPGAVRLSALLGGGSLSWYLLWQGVSLLSR